MAKISSVCRSDWYADTGITRQHGDRSVRCNLATSHDGDHDELVDGQPGVVTWPRVSRVPRFWHPVIIPTDVVQVQNARGTTFIRDVVEVERWWLVDPKGQVAKAVWFTTDELLRVAPPIREVVSDR